MTLAQIEPKKRSFRKNTKQLEGIEKIEEKPKNVENLSTKNAAGIVMCENEQIKVLQRMVQRLNMELGKYQKQGHILDNDIKGNDQKMSNLHHLAPLVIAYDEEIQEKDEIIAEYEEKLYQMKLQ